MIAMIMGMKSRRSKVILVQFPIATCTTYYGDTTFIIFDFNTLSRHVANNTDTTHTTNWTKMKMIIQNMTTNRTTMMMSTFNDNEMPNQA